MNEAAEPELIRVVHRIPTRIPVQIEPPREPDRVLLRGIERCRRTQDKALGWRSLAQPPVRYGGYRRERRRPRAKAGCAVIARPSEGAAR